MPALLPDDVRRWVDQQDPAERDALARTWDLAGLADDAPADTASDAPSATDAAWAQIDALLDTPADPAMDAGLRAWRDRAPAAEALATPIPRVAPALWARPAVWSAVAAAAVVLVAFAWWVRPVTVSAGADVLAHALPDGSAVTLAPGSRVAYRRGLGGDTRRVELEGQAYFSVTGDGRPFMVETFNAGVEVLGTEFDVQAWPGAAYPETAVALVEGSVRVSAEGGAVVLAPGQGTRVVAGRPTAPAPVDASAVVAWRDGAFSVVDAPLGAVAASLSARFGRPVQLARGVDAGQRLTLFLPEADSADTVLRDLASYLGLRVQVGADGYSVLPR